MATAKISEAIAHLPPELPFFSLEFFPPKTTSGLSNLYPRLQRLRTLNPLFVCITFSAGGFTASKSLELADVCQNSLNFRTCLHLTCTNIRRGGVDEVLEKCKELGIRNILALRGDEPREGEYGLIPEPANGSHGDDKREAHERFEHATDLIRYIRRKYGDYFCVGAAAYPEGHPVSSAQHAGGYFQDPAHDLPHLVEKVEAGADFFLTQLFYDVEAYLRFEKLLQNHESGVFKRIPIIPGLMPVQGWGSFTRTCKLARVGVPKAVNARLLPHKADDENVKNVGVNVVSEIVERIQQEPSPGTSIPHGFHFYTLNLEKAVAQILQRCKLVSLSPPPTANGHDSAVANGEAATSVNNAAAGQKKPRRKSSAHNRVLVKNLSASPNNADYETLETHAGRPRRGEQTPEEALSVAEGEGSLGRVATWDDFPNGRWGDARSPAYAPTNNYNLHPNLSRGPALRLWSEPKGVAEITDIFRRYLLGSLSAIPWSEEDSAIEEAASGTLGNSDPQGGLRSETAMIKDELLGMNKRGWWTVASQPAINAANSSDPVVGWGPRNGFVWQKPFVEFFLSSKDWERLKAKLDEVPLEATYFAGNAEGAFEATDENGCNPVTWGSFKGKEIITPTIIEAVSFRAWQTEAFDIWREWSNVFHPSSPSAKLINDLRNDVWLVNVIGQDYTEPERFWNLLLQD